MEERDLKKKSLRLGEILVEWGILDEEKLYQALKIQKESGKKLGEILVEQGFVTEKQVTEALAYEHHLQVVSLNDVQIEEKLLNMFSYQWLKRHNVIPFRLEGDTLTVAVNDPLNLSVLQEIRNRTGYRIKLVLATSKEIKEAINKYYGPLRSAQEAIKEIVIEKGKFQSTEKELSVKELEAVVQEAPIVRLVNSVIGEAIKQSASDVHFEPQRENLRVRFRIDGVLYERMIIPKELQSAVISRIKIISGMDIAEKRKPQDGRMSLIIESKEFDIRVSTLPDIFGEKVVLRILDKKSIIRPLESLGMEEKELKIVKSLIFQPYGMILVTGPTGSGKTTTLYSILNILNDESRNIVTVEDPVEYELDGINQTAINVRAGYTFATAIRHILRQDPDVIMVGEIRDLETAEIAVQAALTGHLVLSTLHTNNAPGAITRLLDMNVEPFLISSSVIGVIAQRLVRKLCPFCKREYIPSMEEKERILKDFSLNKEVILAKPQGCKECYGIGYSGRTGIFEILKVDDEIKNLILKRANESEITQVAISKGMDTLKISGFKKALKKITSLEEVMRVAFVER
ncbi:MAG: type II secretion system protein GspE [Candidatus Aenigmatarchaeota archaeon]|nr:MAG: type II secretion system protein GspE [Candidatus Aenigmarchaeota archaeon]